MAQFKENDRAVSETLGYILIFGIVSACIGMVFITGSQIISDTQESANFQGMEQNFNVISSDLRRTAFEESPVMTTNIKVDYGTLSLSPVGHSDVKMLVYYNGHLYDMDLGSLTFQSSVWGKSISIENGAMVKMYGGNGAWNSLMTQQPRIYYSDSTKTLYIASISLHGEQSAMAGGVSRLQSKFIDSEIYDNYSVSPEAVTICMKSNYTGAWSLYFRDTLSSCGSINTTDPSEYWTNFTIGQVNRMVLVKYNVDVSI